MARGVLWTLGCLVGLGCNSFAGLDALEFAARGGSDTSAGGMGGAGGGDGGASSGPWLEGWGFRRPVRLLEQSGDVVFSFPLAVLIADDEHLRDHARPDAADLVFTRADGTTPLPMEVERYDPASGSLSAWVLVPELGPASTIYLYYSHPDDTAPRDGTAVWRDAHVGVWHASDDFLSPPALVHDSSGAEHHGIPLNAGLTQTDGIAGRALVFDEFDDRVDIADPPDGSLDFVKASFSWSCWVFVTTAADAYAAPFTHGLAIRTYLGSGDWGVSTGDGIGAYDANFGDESLFNGRWVHLVAVVDRKHEEVRAYADGVLRGTGSLSGLAEVIQNGPLKMGSDIHPYLGLLDEVRLYDRALSAEWIAAEFETLIDPASVIAVDAPEEAP